MGLFDQVMSFGGWKLELDAFMINHLLSTAYSTAFGTYVDNFVAK
jgi:hypothetical protein